MMRIHSTAFPGLPTTSIGVPLEFHWDSNAAAAYSRHHADPGARQSFGGIRRADGL